MWALENNTPFAAERAWVRDKQGSEVWVVAIKASFELSTSGQVTVAEHQPPVCLTPAFTDDTHQELLFDSDLHEYKTATDVLVYGHAHAPGGQPAKQWLATLQVGPVNKTLLVSGRRVWQSDQGRVQDCPIEPATRVPLSYRFAFGGRDNSPEAEPDIYFEDNPLGLGYCAGELPDQPILLPQLEYPDRPITSLRDRCEPASFGAVAGHWPVRFKYAGTYDEHWERTRQPLWPEDLDPQFFQCSPRDQQVPGFLKGGEEVQLTHLCALDYLRFRLPKITFHLETDFSDGESLVHRPVLHTVILEPDQHRFAMVWHSHLPCHHSVNLLESTHIHIKQRIFDPEENAFAKQEG